jgi:hypothetical protein
VCYQLNHTYNENNKGFPIQRLTGDTPDISVLLRFYFWKMFYYKQVNATFPSDSVEQAGHIVGISDHCGNSLTYRVLNPSTLNVIHRSSICPATVVDPNLREESLGGEIDDDIAPNLKSRNDFIDKDTKLHTTNYNHHSPSIIDMEDIIGRSFIMDKHDDGRQFRARIVKLIEDHDAQVDNNKDRVKVLLSSNDDTSE